MGLGHHGGHGTTAAAMVHRVLLISVSFVCELYVKYTFPPNKILYCSRAIYPTGSRLHVSKHTLLCYGDSPHRSNA